jgi:hypothetical protein
VRRGRIGGRAAWETEVTAVMEVLLAFAASAEHGITPG